MVIILELIYFNQKNYYLQRQSKLSAAQHKIKQSIYFFLQAINQACSTHGPLETRH